MSKQLMTNFQKNPTGWARMAGICYFIIIVTGILAQLLIHKPLASLSDTVPAAITLASSWSWRLGLLSDIVMQVIDIPVMIILYFLLKPVNKAIALMGLGFNLIQTAVLVVNKLALIIPMIVLGNPAYQTVFEKHQLNALIKLLFEINTHGFSLGFIFFGCACLVYGYLIFNSTYLPALIGILVSIAGLSYLIYSLSVILIPAFASYVSPILILCLLGELSFCLWLMIKGINEEKWNQVLQYEHFSS